MNANDARHIFQSTRPSRGETMLPDEKRAIRQISIHSPLAGRDAETINNEEGATIFQSTRPSRGETTSTMFVTRLYGFQSTRPSRGETYPAASSSPACPISIHSPLAGRDPRKWRRRRPSGYFNPLAPRGARQDDPVRGRRAADFNPLAPRGARRPSSWALRPRRNFNPLAPRGARPAPPSSWPSSCISIHSPLAGRDVSVRHRFTRSKRFQSTRPSRGETRWRTKPTAPWSRFQSTRPSRGETARVRRVRRSVVFQSTRPSRGETRTRRCPPPPVHISIHSPLAGRDGHQAAGVHGPGISIHSPLAGRDASGWRCNRRQRISIHSPLAGRDSKIAQNHARDYCNSHNQPLEHG